MWVLFIGICVWIAMYWLASAVRKSTIEEIAEHAKAHEIEQLRKEIEILKAK